MKRLISLFIVAAMLVLSLPVTAAAAGANYEIVLETPASYKTGETVKVIATVKNIALSGGVSGVHFMLHYDDELLDVVTSGNIAINAFKSGDVFTSWDDLSRVDAEIVGGKFVSANNGVVSIEACDSGGELGDTYKNAGLGAALVFEISFTAKANATSDLVFSIDASETECVVLNSEESGYSLHSGIASGSKIEKTVMYNDGSCKNHSPSTPEYCTDDIVCTLCGEPLEEGGEHSYDDKTVEPDCTEHGYIEHTCKNCPYSYKDNYTDPQHTPGEWTAVEEGKEELRCSVCGELIDERDVSVEITYILGDVDNNGKIEADDYILLKRIFFGTAKLDTLEVPETSFLRCDVDTNEKIEADDYILLKRVFFGTAKIS